ncbi:MAG: archease [Planctomycetota bacterium]
MAEERYRLIEHTADLAFVAYGKDVRELFQNAAFALFDVYADLSKVEENIEKQINISIQAEAEAEEPHETDIDYEQLLVKWLNEFLYLNEVEDLLFKRFNVVELTATGLSATACGERFNPERHAILTPLKAVTYHRIEVVQEPDRWRARVVVDL